MQLPKQKKSLYALRLIRNFFKKEEMKIYLDSNFYSILYYNAVIWLSPRSVKFRKFYSVLYKFILNKC